MEAALVWAADAVAAAGLSDWARSGPNVYPIANSIHLLGLVMLVGGIGVVDLRLAGLFRTLPAAALTRTLVPIAAAGLLVAVSSGVILFAADAPALATSGIFKLKLLLVALATANAVAFHLLWRHRLDDWDRAPPLAGRAMAFASLFAWLSVGTAGRLIAYV